MQDSAHAVEVEGLSVHGVDMIRWDDTGRITSFTVMVRPHKGLVALMSAMFRELTRAPEPGGS